MRVVLIVTMVYVGLVTANLDSERETDVSVSQLLMRNIRAPPPRMYTVDVHDVLALKVTFVLFYCIEDLPYIFHSEFAPAISII